MDDKDLFINLDNEELFQNNIESSEEDIDEAEDIESNEEDIDEEKDIKSKKYIIFIVIIAIIIIVGITFGIIKTINKHNETENEKIIVPSIRYECEQGYELLYNECSKTTTIDANKNYYCSADYQMINNKCVKYEYTTATKEYEPCPENQFEGYHKCYYRYPVIEPTYEYDCPSNSTKINNNCYMLTNTFNAIKTYDGGYQCSPVAISDWYELKGTLCYYYIKVNKTLTNAKCPENYFYNDSSAMEKGCHRIDEYDQKYKYTCPNGYSLDSNNNCITTSTQAIKVEYWCEDGYILSENKCIKTETIAPKTIYTCPTNYINENDICKKIK